MDSAGKRIVFDMTDEESKEAHIKGGIQEILEELTTLGVDSVESFAIAIHYKDGHARMSAAGTPEDVVRLNSMLGMKILGIEP